MLIALIDVSFGSEREHLLEVVNIDVHKDTEESFHDVLHTRLKVLGEGGVGIGREHVFVVHLIVDPIHEGADVLRCGERRRLLVFVTIRP